MGHDHDLKLDQFLEVVDLDRNGVITREEFQIMNLQKKEDLLKLSSNRSRDCGGFKGKYHQYLK